MSFSIGVPKEIKPQEKRVGIVPATVKKLSGLGLKIFLEAGAGEGSGFSDDDYRQAGALVLATGRDVYRQSEIILKVKEPQPEEYSLLQKGQILFCFLHLASPAHCKLIDALARAEVTAIGFETLEKSGRLPLLAPMSEIAGGLAAAYGAFFSGFYKFENVMKLKNLPEKLLEIASDYPHYTALGGNFHFVIYGGGIAGEAAVRVANQMGHQASIVEPILENRNRLKAKQITVYAPEEVNAAVLENADILIGTAHQKGKRAAMVFEKKIFEDISRRKQRVYVDVAIDQGGNFYESKPTVYDHPVYLDLFGNLRFCVANMPSFCGRYASEKLSEAACEFVEVLGRLGQAGLDENVSLRAAVNMRSGKIMNLDILKAHQRGEHE